MADASRSLRRRIGRAVSGTPVPSPTSGPARGKGGRTSKVRRAKPPNVEGRGPLLAGKGFGLVLVAIVKDEADHLEEWLAYHIALGVDHFFIYDNGSTDDSAALLGRYINHGLVTRIDWPMASGQLPAYNHALRMFGTTTEWMGFYDPDEFLVPLHDDDIPALLARFDDAADVRIPRIEFGYSGHRQAPEALSIDAYTQVANVLALDPDVPPRVKSIVRPGAVSAVGVHLAFLADVPAAGAPTRTVGAEVVGLAQLNHYYTRSFDEFEAKRYRGSATGRPLRPAVPWDLPTLATDTSAQRFSERTRTTIERLRRLEARPYNYGSQLGVEGFPRPNNLFRFSEYTVANFAAGREEPMRFATSRLKNRYPGIGLVCDISGDAFTAERGAFLASPHTAALVDHLGGRVETSLDLSDSLPMMTTAGTLAIPGDGPALLDMPAGSAEVLMELPATEMLRCYALAFLVEAPLPVRLEATLVRRDDSEGELVSMELPASPATVGVVEIEPLPQQGARVRLRFEGEAGDLRIHDLFVISYG